MCIRDSFQSQLTRFTMAIIDLCAFLFPTTIAKNLNVCGKYYRLPLTSVHNVFDPNIQYFPLPEDLFAIPHPITLPLTLYDFYDFNFLIQLTPPEPHTPALTRFLQPAPPSIGPSPSLRPGLPDYLPPLYLHSIFMAPAKSLSIN